MTQLGFQRNLNCEMSFMLNLSELVFVWITVVNNLMLSNLVGPEGFQCSQT